MTGDMITQIIVFVSALIIIVRTEPALNRMSGLTPFTIRYSFHMLAIGAAAEIVFVLSGDVPNWPTAISSTGVAALLFCERRLRVLYPPHRRRFP